MKANRLRRTVHHAAFTRLDGAQVAARNGALRRIHIGNGAQTLRKNRLDIDPDVGPDATTRRGQREHTTSTTHFALSEACYDGKDHPNVPQRFGMALSFVQNPRDLAMRAGLESILNPVPSIMPAVPNRL